MTAEDEPGKPIVNISGERVALGPPRRDLVPVYQRWMNDFEVTRTLAIGLRSMTHEAEEAWYERISKAESDVIFTIYELGTMRPVGSTGLHDIDHRHRTAEFGIVIGEKDCWDRGYGTEATKLVLDYGFNGLGLHNIMLSVYSYNRRGIRAYERAGFKVIGRRREAHRLGSDAHDIVLMDCLATEFKSPALGRLLEPPR